MLVLSRKPGEWIHVGDNISVVVVNVRGVTVRLGIEAPDDIRIVRQELLGVRPQWGKYDGRPYADGPSCRECIKESNQFARFEDDDRTTWTVDDRGVPEGTLYKLLPFPEQGPCGSCLPVP